MIERLCNNKKATVRGMRERGFILLLTMLSVVALFAVATLLVKIYVSMKGGVERGEGLVIAEQAAVSGIEDAVYQLKRSASWNRGFTAVPLPGNGATYTMTFDTMQKALPCSTNNIAGAQPVTGWRGTIVPAHGAHLVSQGRYGSATCVSEAVVVLSSELFYDIFPKNGTYPDTWTDYVGKNFRVTNGVFHVGTPGKNTLEHRAFAGSRDWKDCSVNLKVTLCSNKGTGPRGFGVYFRTTAVDPLDSYLFRYDPSYEEGRNGGAFIFQKIVKGVEQPPFAVMNRNATPLGGSPAWWFDVERKVRVDLAGNRFTAYVDDVKVLEGSDAQDLFGSGQIGLRVWGDVYVKITEAKVTSGTGSTLQYRSRW